MSDLRMGSITRFLSGRARLRVDRNRCEVVDADTDPVRLRSMIAAYLSHSDFPKFCNLLAKYIQSGGKRGALVRGSMLVHGAAILDSLMPSLILAIRKRALPVIKRCVSTIWTLLVSLESQKKVSHPSRKRNQDLTQLFRKSEHHSTLVEELKKMVIASDTPHELKTFLLSFVLGTCGHGLSESEATVILDAVLANTAGELLEASLLNTEMQRITPLRLRGFTLRTLASRREFLNRLMVNRPLWELFQSACREGVHFSSFNDGWALESEPIVGILLSFSDALLKEPDLVPFADMSHWAAVVASCFHFFGDIEAQLPLPTKLFPTRFPPNVRRAAFLLAAAGIHLVRALLPRLVELVLSIMDFIGPRVEERLRLIDSLRLLFAGVSQMLEGKIIQREDVKALRLLRRKLKVALYDSEEGSLTASFDLTPSSAELGPLAAHPSSPKEDSEPSITSRARGLQYSKVCAEFLNHLMGERSRSPSPYDPSQISSGRPTSQSSNDLCEEERETTPSQSSPAPPPPPTKPIANKAADVGKPSKKPLLERSERRMMNFVNSLYNPKPRPRSHKRRLVLHPTIESSFGIPQSGWKRIKKDITHEPSEWCDVAILQPEFTSHRLEKDEDIGVISHRTDSDHSLTDILSNVQYHVFPNSKKEDLSRKNLLQSSFAPRSSSCVSRSSSFASRTSPSFSSSYSAWSIPNTSTQLSETPQYIYKERLPLVGDAAVPLYQRPPPPIPDYRELQSHQKNKHMRRSRSRSSGRKPTEDKFNEWDF